MAQIDFTPSQPAASPPAKIDFRPSKPLSPENAAKMRELYPDDDGSAKVDFKPVAGDSRVNFKPKIAFKPTETNYHIKDTLSNIGKAAGGAAEAVGNDLFAPLKEKGNPVAKLGEAGARAGDVPGELYSLATAIPKGVGQEVIKDTGLGKAGASYVAGKMGANPEQKEVVGEKLKDVFADIASSALVNAAGAAVGGKEGTAEKIASPAIKDGEKIYTGKDHEAIRQSMPEGSIKGADANTGFVTTKGRFIDRVEAQKMAKAQGQFDHEEKGPDELHSQELAPATIKTKQGFEVANTRGQGQQYHGSPNKISNLAEYTYAPQNIYGQGFYTTDAGDVAHGYANRKGAEKPTLYKVTENNPVKLFDMAQPIPKSVAAYIEKGSNEALQIALEDSSTLKQLYDNARAESRGAGLSTSDMHEDFDGIADVLRQEGYAGLEHRGGSNTGTTPHRVKIYFDPAKDITISELAPDAFKRAEKTPAASPAAKEEAPKTVADQLFRMSNKDVARRVDAKNTLKAIKGVDNATWEKLYAYKDDPKGVKLTPEEQALYDKHIKPVAERSTALRKELAKKGVPFEEGDTGGAPRKVKGKNPLVERIYGNKAAEKTARAGSKLSTFSPTLKAREMWALPGKVGERPIVFVRDGKIFKDGEQIGELAEGGVPTAGADTNVGKLEQATTSEIEKATKLEYHKNLLANEYLNWQSLERANDAADFLEDAKKNPEFLEFAAPPQVGRNSEVPESWRRLNVENKAFEGWKFDPKMAEVIEDYLGDAKSPEDFTKGVTNIAKTMRASIFYNPIRHMVNATNMFGTSLGAVKGAADVARGRLPVALARATKNVLTQSKALRSAMDDGLSLPGMRNEANKFHEELIRAMGRSIQSDPQAFSRLAKEWGYKSPVGMMQALYKGSSKLLWAYSDILTDARYEMYKMDGLSSREAVRKTHQVMADYRVPSRVAGSRALSKGLQNPAATLFGRYDYNRMANLAGMVKRAAKNDKAGWEARDQLLALAAITTVGYKVVDKILQDATGEKDAHYGMGGYSTLVDDAVAVGSGRKSPAQALESAFSPGLLSTPLEILLDQNLYTGKPIMQRGDFDSLLQGGKRGDDLKHIGYDAGSYFAEKFAPVQAVASAVANKDPASKIIAEQLGASFPKSNTKAKKYSRNSAKSANKKRPGFAR